MNVPILRPALALAVLDSSPLILHGVGQMLGGHARIRIVHAGPAGNPRSGTPERADVTLYGVDGATFAAGKASQDATAVLADPAYGRVLAYGWGLTPAQVDRARTTGFVGHVDKSSSAAELADAVVAAAARWPGHQHGLSRREAQVLSLIAAGLTNEEIGQATHLSANTVKTYIRTAYQKVGVARRAEAVAWALQRGLVSARRTPPAPPWARATGS